MSQHVQYQDSQTKDAKWNFSHHWFYYFHQNSAVKKAKSDAVSLGNVKCIIRYGPENILQLFSQKLRFQCDSLLVEIIQIKMMWYLLGSCFLTSEEQVFFTQRQICSITELQNYSIMITLLCLIVPCLPIVFCTYVFAILWLWFWLIVQPCFIVNENSLDAIFTWFIAPFRTSALSAF